MGEFYSPILASRRRWARHGQSGLWVSDWLPHIATCADDIAVIRSCWANGLNHSNGVSQMNTGSIVGGHVVSAGTGQEEAAARLFADPDVAFLQTRNVIHGCYMLTIRRRPEDDSATA